MNRAAALLLAGSSLLLASTARARASVEAGPAPASQAGQGGSNFTALNFNFTAPSVDVLTDRLETIVNQVTEQPADVPQALAASNVQAGLRVIQQAEGTFGERDPYRVCYAYTNEIDGTDGVNGTFDDWIDHPTNTGEWRGERLPESMCRAAGFGGTCFSTAAGAYQLIRPTWNRARDALGLPDFSPANQDRAAVWLIEQRGALEDLKAGRFAAFVSKCRNEWASLPGNYARQGQRSIEQLVTWYQIAGGNLA